MRRVVEVEPLAGELVFGVRIGDWAMPWNAKAEAGLGLGEEHLPRPSDRGPVAEGHAIHGRRIDICFNGCVRGGRRVTPE
jgi:hypothetical protein